MSFSEKLKRFRQKMDLNQKQFAQALGIPYQMISRYENDKASPSIDTVQKIADSLNISISELLGEKTPEIHEPDVSQEEFMKLQSELIEVLQENRELRKYLEQNQK